MQSQSLAQGTAPQLSPGDMQPWAPSPQGDFLQAAANGSKHGQYREFPDETKKKIQFEGFSGLGLYLSYSFLVLKHPFFYEIGIITGDGFILMSLLGKIKRR